MNGETLVGWVRRKDGYCYQGEERLSLYAFLLLIFQEPFQVKVAAEALLIMNLVRITQCTLFLFVLVFVFFCLFVCLLSTLFTRN